ncbi:IPExxxVDY family protein [Muriicola soli]|uniref:IPExxxVDY family protein n=1 Tax=Muriicola soli TaxID=2507538 RepID=A0A411ECX5_9FLAO|nr:IPExxxVDY family protein [Muriicola soli]QBA65260.1 IPExxxVDY family protein [Muriicola soli]
MQILEESYEEEFALVGIYTNLEDYALAYALNESLRLHLRKAETDLVFSSEVIYPYFEWKDEMYDREWSLLINSCITTHQSASGNLFPEEPSFSNHLLVPEYKEVNFLLKVEPEALDAELLLKIKSIPKVIAAYVIETTKLKSKHNLIF